MIGVARTAWWGEALIAASGDYTLIAESTLGAAAASITFSSIPQTYTHLELFVTGSWVSGSRTACIVTLNGDTATSWTRQSVFSEGGTATADAGAYQGATIAFLPGTAVHASDRGQGWSVIPDYTRAWHKSVMSTWGGAVMGVNYGRWPNTAAITSITLAHVSGTNFEAGSTASLYGLS